MFNKCTPYTLFLEALIEEPLRGLIWQSDRALEFQSVQIGILIARASAAE